MFQPRESNFAPAASEPNVELSFGALFDSVRRNRGYVIWCVICCVAVALAYCLLATPMYTASSAILIDTRQGDVIDKRNEVNDTLIDTGYVDSQVGILLSDDLVASVVKQMKLDEDPEYIGPPKDIFGLLLWKAVDWTTRLIGAGPEATEAQKLHRVVEAVQKKLKVERDKESYVVTVSFQSQNAEKSARVANAISDAYLVGGLEAKYTAAKRASEWLTNRSAELRQQATDADHAVQVFKAEANIVGTNRGLMSEQQLTDVNTQLIEARATTAEAKARLDRINEFDPTTLAGGQTVVSDALNNQVIIRLRAQYLDLAAQYDDWSRRYGKTHQATLDLEHRMVELRNSMADEVKRIADAYRSDYEIAKSREASLEADLKKLVGDAATADQAQVKLRNLEATADSYRNLYNDFLAKLQVANQSASFPISDARIISTAVAPSIKSWPKTLLLLIGASIVGVVIGSAIATLKDYSDEAFRTRRDVEMRLGVECLGILPEISRRTRSSARWAARRVRTSDAPVAPMLEMVALQPYSRFSETLRNVRASIESTRLKRPVQVVCIASSVPKEGKSVVSANLARLACMSGVRVLLVDCDLHGRSLTKQLAPGAVTGLLQALQNSDGLSEHIVRLANCDLDFLPATFDVSRRDGSTRLSSSQMSELLPRLRSRYDYIVLDLAPVLPVTDAKAISHLVDSFVYVIKWGDTPRSIVAEAISSAGEPFREKLLGVVLNRASEKELGRYEPYKAKILQTYYMEPT